MDPTRMFKCVECGAQSKQDHNQGCSYSLRNPGNGVSGEVAVTNYLGEIFDEVAVPDGWPDEQLDEDDDEEPPSKFAENQTNPLHQYMRENFDDCIAISVAKNADYASGVDPLQNFRACEAFGVTLVKGIMVRLSDKLARIGNLLDREAKVKDEKITDTIKDAQVYLSILLYALETE